MLALINGQFKQTANANINLINTDMGIVIFIACCKITCKKNTKAPNKCVS